MPKSVLDLHYADGRTSLVMEADLDGGWGRLEKTYGFFHYNRVPYRNDLTIRAQLSLIAQPAGFDEWAKKFPPFESKAGDSDLSYEFQGSLFVLKVALLPHMAWRKTPQGRPELYVEEVPFLPIGEGRSYDLRAWIVFHEGSRRPVSDIRVWTENNLIVPGGQVESNRRRH